MVKLKLQPKPAFKNALNHMPENDGDMRMFVLGCDRVKDKQCFQMSTDEIVIEQ